jgi:anti-sigma B factor antagonist
MALQPTKPAPSKDGTGEVMVVHFAGHAVSLDEETLDSIREQLLALVDEPNWSNLILDFGNIAYLSSMALGMLVGLHRRLLASGRHMTVGNLRPRIYQVFAATRLDKYLSLRLAGQAAEPAVLVSGWPRRRQEQWIEPPCKGV